MAFGLSKKDEIARLPPDVNKILFVKYELLFDRSNSEVILSQTTPVALLRRNLPFKISPEELYDIFGKYGAIRQIRMYVL